jgi:hypothetical protein
VSCSIFSSNSIKEDYSQSIKSFNANFVFIEQDTISFSIAKIFNYCIFEDSYNTKFFVLEDGCSFINYKSLMRVGLKDTIRIHACWA